MYALKPENLKSPEKINEILKNLSGILKSIEITTINMSSHGDQQKCFYDLVKIAAIWEFRFRNLCGLVKIKSFDYKDHEGKIIVRYKKLDNLKRNFEEEHPHFNGQIQIFQELRNLIIHGNFYALEKYLQAYMNRSMTNSVVELNIKNDKLCFLEGDLTSEKLNSMNMGSHMLRALSNELYKIALCIFLIGLDHIDHLMDLRQLEGDLFNKLFKSGERLNQNDLTGPCTTFKYAIQIKRNGISKEDFLQRFYLLLQEKSTP